MTGVSSLEGMSYSIVDLDLKTEPAYSHCLEGPSSGLVFFLFLDWPTGTMWLYWLMYLDE